MSLDYADLTKDELERLRIIREIEELEVKTLRSSRAHDLEVANSLESRGVLNFYEQVNDNTVYACMKALENLTNRFPGTELELRLHSPGGSVIAGLHLFDFLQDLRAAGHHLTTATYGMAASMGGILLQAGDHRVASRHAYLLIHEVSYGAGGKVTEMEDEAAFAKALQARTTAILAERSTMTAKQIVNRMARRDWWMDADEALKLGFVDEVR